MILLFNLRRCRYQWNLTPIEAQKIKIGWFDRFRMGWMGGDIGSKTCVRPSTGFLPVSMKQTEQVIPGDGSVAASGSVVLLTGVRRDRKAFSQLSV